MSGAKGGEEVKGEPEGEGGGSQLGDWRGEGDIRREGSYERTSVDGREGVNREMTCERQGGPEGQNATTVQKTQRHFRLRKRWDNTSCL